MYKLESNPAEILRLSYEYDLFLGYIIEYLDNLSSDVDKEAEDLAQKGKLTVINHKGVDTHVIWLYNNQFYNIRTWLEEEDVFCANCSCGKVDCVHIPAVLKRLCDEIVANDDLSSLMKPHNNELLEQQKRILDANFYPETLRAVLRRKDVNKSLIRTLDKLYGLYNSIINSFTLSNLRFGDIECFCSKADFMYSWQSIEILPRKPTNSWELWLFIASYFKKNNISVISDLKPHTDTSSVDEEYQAFQDKLEEKRLLKEFVLREKEQEVSHLQYLDVRLALGRNELFFLSRKSRTSNWCKMSHNELRDLFISSKRSSNCDMGCQLMFNLFRAQFECGQYRLILDAELFRSLYQYLTLPIFRSMLATVEGEQFLYEESPLRWVLKEPQSEKEKYEFRLCKQNLEPLENCNWVLGGNPTFYVTDNIIYQGPTDDNGLLCPDKVNYFHRGVIESRSGLFFLRRIGVEPPSSLASRIVSVKLKPNIKCRLQGRGARDYLAIEIRAEENNYAYELHSFGWQKNEIGKKSDTDEWTVYDTDALAFVVDYLYLLKGSFDKRRNNCYLLAVTKDFPRIFIEWYNNRSSDVEFSLSEELQDLVNNSTVSAQIKIQAEPVGIDWFDVEVVVDLEALKLSGKEFKMLLKAQGKFVRLANGSWRRLEFEVSEDDQELLAGAGLSHEFFEGGKQRLHVLQLMNPKLQRSLPAEVSALIQKRAEEIKLVCEPEVPAQISANLRPYQVSGYHFLSYLSENNFGGILADDMGLGKTLQVLVWLTNLKQQNRAKHKCSLIVAPKSVTYNWAQEVSHFASELKTVVFDSASIVPSCEELEDICQGTDILVFNYTQLRIYSNVLSSIDWLAVILDEGQYIKNPNSQVAQTARQLKSVHRLVLTGTPIENRLLDLWSLMAFAFPGALGNRSQFSKYYNSNDLLARKRLGARIRPFLLRRTKEEVASELPAKTEEDIFCELEGKQLMLYKAELKHAQQKILNVKTQKQLQKLRFDFLSSLMKLRQIACHAGLASSDLRNEPSAKLDVLFEQLEELVEAGNKALVFSQFLGMLDIIRQRIKALAWSFYYLDGSTEKREQIIEDFQNHEGSAIFLISLRAGGFGLNLTAAQYVFLCDPWWNPAVEQQAIDRTHRIGQEQHVFAYRLLAKNTIDEKIRLLQQKKGLLAKDIFEEAHSGAQLTLEDFRFLFAMD